MGLKLPWRATGSGESAATVGGYTLTAFVSGDGGSWEVEYAAADVLPLPTTLAAAQEAAEAAAARLLAEDAGVRGLLGLRWIPVTEQMPEEGAVVWTYTPHLVDEVRELPLRFSGGRWYNVGVELTLQKYQPTHWMPRPPAPEAST